MHFWIPGSCLKSSMWGKKLLIFLKTGWFILKRLFKELMPDLLCFVYCVYHMLIFFNIKLYRYVLATRKVFRRMAKHRWQHKCPLDFPYLRIFKLRISSSCVCFLIRILSNNSPIFLCRWIVLQDEKWFLCIE